MGDSERNRERERPPPRWTTHTPSFSYSPFLASLFSSLFLLILRSVFSSFLLLLLRPSATRRNSSAIHEPHLARLREISRDPIRYPIFRISPLLLFRPHIASRDRFVVVRHSHLNHSCTRLSESALRVEQLTVDLNTIPTSSPARYFPISSIDSTLFHIFRHTSYYPLATTIIYISVLPRLVRHLRHYVSFFFRFPLFSSTPSSPHVHPACSFLPFVFRSLGLVPVVVPSTEPNDARTAPPNPRGSSSRSLSPAVDLFVSPSWWALLRPLSARLCSVVVCRSKMVHLPSLACFRFYARRTHPIRFGLVGSFIHSSFLEVCVMALIIIYFLFIVLFVIRVCHI